MKNRSHVFTRWIIAAGVLCALASAVIMSSCSPAGEPVSIQPHSAVRYPGEQPGLACASAGRGIFGLSNRVIAASWNYKGKQFTRRSLRNCVTGQTVPIGEDLFVILLNGKEPVRSSNLLLKNRPDIQPLLPDPDAARLDERLGGMKISIELAAPDNSLEVEWRALLRNGANYIRREVTVKTLKDPVPLKTIVMINNTIPDSRPGGDVQGSLMVTDTMFFGYEHPMADNNNGTELCFISRWADADVPFPERGVMDWDVSAIVTSATEYQPQIVQHTGTNRMHIYGVALLADGREVSRDEHFGFTGSDKDSNNFYRLILETYNPEAAYTLRVFTLGNGGSDSRGVVKMKRISTAPLVYCAYTRDMPVMPGESYSGSFVTGVVPAGQMRRGVLYYLERHRVHPYRTFLHYNSWYDIGYFTKYNEKDCLDVINAYGRELTEKRGVKIDSFLFDDGWDEPASLWNMHTGFPKGFLPLKTAAEKYNAAPGAWLSPWGGYHGPRRKRIQYGVARGFETNAHGFALSGSNYFKRFSETCLDMVTRYGVNQFKFDGVGRSGGGAGGNRDFEAAMRLITMLRREKKDIYINLTTGTWPSPFWLQYADSIWRGGYDHQFAGVGTKRQQWITYRDGDTYERIVSRAPLFPLNSLMLHGIIYARHAKGLTNATGTDLKAEIRSGLGTGTQLQELYITPGFLTESDWDALAEAAAWARRNADILVDTHWVGGDPKKQEVYGWSAWSSRGATLVLRNPSDKPQQIEIEPQKVFELPEGAPQTYTMKSPYADQRIQKVVLTAGAAYTFSLEPFEVLVFDADGSSGVVE